MVPSLFLFIVGVLAAGGSRSSPSIAKMVVEDHHYWILSPLLIGLDNQVVHVQVDTASSELWVFQRHGNCTLDSSLVPPEFTIGSNVCEAMGAFAPNDLSSFVDINKTMEILYAGGDRVKGNYGSDKVVLGSVEVKDQLFGIANTLTLPFGVLGLGFDLGISINDTRAMYPNLPRSLQQQGDIDRLAFGLYLSNSLNQNGLIIFGGYDDAKVSGDFTEVPFIKNASTYKVSLTNMTFLGFPLIELPKVALMDTGAANIYVPKDMYRLILIVLGVEQRQGEDVIKCPSDDSLLFEFTFGNFSVKVPLNSIVVPSKDSNEYCRLDGISSFDTSYIMMGMPIFRHMYLVFDVDDRCMRLAAVNHTDDENLTAFDESTANSSTRSNTSSVSSALPSASIKMPQLAIPYSSRLFASDSVSKTSSTTRSSQNTSKLSLGYHTLVTGWLLMVMLAWF